MKPGIIQRIFKDHIDVINATHRLEERSRRAAWNIRTCRTAAQGYHIDECPNGDYRILLNNSCRHRACPLCGATETELWLERQSAKELHCPHHHMVFTSPDSLRELWRWNRKGFTNLYFRAAWHSLCELLADSRWLGGVPGVIAVFQSWGDELQEHLHLHFIVTSGGLACDGKWVDANREYLLPVPVLAAKFRGKFLAYLRVALKAQTDIDKVKSSKEILIPPPGMTLQQCLNMLNKLGRKKWHVQIEPAYTQTGGVLKYVGRYIRRGPLSERRISSYDGKQVIINYAHPQKHTRPSFTLQAKDFILRLLKHVPEKGTHSARVYGLYHSACREKLNQARACLGQPAYQPEAEPPDTHELLRRMFPDFTGDLCPKCHARLITVVVIRPGHAPPGRYAA
ncbi:MAG: transposase [Gammaproteobacteria bacterium]|nr:transposase [Gammaproteobacteria bacterium]